MQRLSPIRVPQTGHGAALDTPRRGAVDPLAALRPPNSRVLTVLAVGMATLLIRAPNFGDPNYHIDESFYLLVGKQMQLGALPYVDIWDRKPLGLFLIYAAIAALGGTGIPQYHMVAGLFAFATALVIAAIVRRLYGPGAAIFAAIIYLATLEALAGGGGQSPVFYNLFVATAMLLTMRAAAATRIERFGRLALGAMALGGVAVFVKQTAAVECLSMGAALLAASWRLDPRPSRLTARALCYAAIGLAPTALAFLCYVAAGHAADFWFANVTSIFLKQGPAPADRLDMALHLSTRLLPLLAMAAAGCLLLARHAQRRDARLVIGWLVAAMAGFLAVPNFWDHYALPLAAPLSIASAALLARPATAMIYASLATAWPLYHAGWPAIERTHRSRADFAAAVKLIERHRGDGLLYIYDGPPLLYAATGSPLPTRHAFSEHINNQDEAGATGIDPGTELQRILALRPRVIVTGVTGVVRHPNIGTRSALRRALARDYRRVAILPLQEYAFSRPTEFWVRLR